MRILLVEDQPKIASFVQAGLQDEGLEVDLCHDGIAGLRQATSESYDALILDIMLPGRDGLSILRHLRQAQNPVPILLLTARDTLPERVEGLNLGADDYLTKPFYMEELIARLHTIVRRSQGKALNFLEVDDLRLDLTLRQVSRQGQEIGLSGREQELLEFLMRRPHKVLSRLEICQHVWPYQIESPANLVDVYIKRLRRKIDEPFARKLIHTIRGVGYRLGAPTPEKS